MKKNSSCIDRTLSTIFQFSLFWLYLNFIQHIYFFLLVKSPLDFLLAIGHHPLAFDFYFYFDNGAENVGKMIAPSGSSSSEPSVNQGPQSNGADAGPSGAPSSSSFEEDSFELQVLEESSYGTGTSREGMPVNQQAAIPVPPANPPEAPLEALPQAPAEVAHPAPNQEEIAALKRELQGQIQEQIREESERGVGPLSILFPEQRELYSDTSAHIMADLELSTETNVNNLREWVEKLREDKNLLKPLIKDYLPKR
jgi:hypothetical protein